MKVLFFEGPQTQAIRTRECRAGCWSLSDFKVPKRPATRRHQETGPGVPEPPIFQETGNSHFMGNVPIFKQWHKFKISNFSTLHGPTSARGRKGLLVHNPCFLHLGKNRFECFPPGKCTTFMACKIPGIFFFLSFFFNYQASRKNLHLDHEPLSLASQVPSFCPRAATPDLSGQAWYHPPTPEGSLTTHLSPRNVYTVPEPAACSASCRHHNKVKRLCKEASFRLQYK